MWKLWKLWFLNIFHINVISNPEFFISKELKLSKISNFRYNFHKIPTFYKNKWSLQVQILTFKNCSLVKFLSLGRKNHDMAVLTRQLGSIKLDCLIFSIVPLRMSHVSLSVSLGYSLGYPQDLSDFKNFIFGSIHDTVYKIIYFSKFWNACSIPITSHQLVVVDCSRLLGVSSWGCIDGKTCDLKFDPIFDFGHAEKKSCSDVFFDGSEFRTASGDTASVVSTDFMKFKILKKFSKISKFSQIILSTALIMKSCDMSRLMGKKYWFWGKFE